MSYSIEKALAKAVKASQTANNLLLALDFDNVVSYVVVPTPAQQTNSRLDVTIQNGRVVKYGYNRENLRQVIESELGLNSEVIVSGDINAETVAEFYTNMGITILPEEITVTNIVNKAVYIKTTNQSLRFYGEVMLVLSGSDDAGNDVYLQSDAGDTLLDQSGNPLMAQETSPDENTETETESSVDSD